MIKDKFKNLTKEQISERIILAKDGDMSARDDIIISLMPMVISCCRPYYQRAGFDNTDDIYSVALESLTCSVDKYTSGEDVIIPIYTYVRCRAEWAAQEYYRSSHCIVTPNRHDREFPSFSYIDDFCSEAPFDRVDENSIPLDEKIQKSRSDNSVNSFVKSLSPKDKKIAFYIMEIGGFSTLSEIGNSEGITEACVCHTIKRRLKKWRNDINLQLLGRSLWPV